MCRLFALHAGEHNVAADFWLLDAPGSLAAQSEINADGYGLAALTADEGLILMRNPVRASGDAAYEQVARRLNGCQMLVHLRYADTGSAKLVNTHPFSQDGRLFAHNGVVGDLERLEHRLGSDRAMVQGDTDSERFAALVTISIREAGGDVREGIRAAVNELADDYELYSLNFVLGERGHIWAFRYPAHNELFLLEKKQSDEPLEQGSSDGSMRLRSEDLEEHPFVVVASERISDDPGWQEVQSGELIHIGPDLKVDRELIVDHEPAIPMVLKGRAAESQVA
jgi:glutamine amidotransferase